MSYVAKGKDVKGKCYDAIDVTPSIPDIVTGQLEPREGTGGRVNDLL